MRRCLPSVKHIPEAPGKHGRTSTGGRLRAAILAWEILPAKLGQWAGTTLDIPERSLIARQERQRGIMRSSLVKKGLVTAGLFGIAMLLLLVALPWIASTQIVRDRIAFELSAWSGHRVELGEAPSIVIWPTFQARLVDVALYDWSQPEGEPVLEAEAAEIDLSAFAALRGDVVFSAMRLQRPRLRIAVPEPARAKALESGVVGRAVVSARKVVDANPAAPDTSKLPGDAFGTIEFVDGQVVIEEHGRETELITSLSGRLAWPSLNRAAELSASGIWRGENVTLEASSAQPLLLMAGGNTATKLNVTSNLVNASFDGSASLAPEPFLDGTISMSSPSLRRMLEWSQTEISPGAAVGEASLSAHVTGGASRLKFENVQLALGGSTGVGVLEASYAEGNPALTGTLDFETLDFASFLTAFSPLAAGRGNLESEIDTSFSDEITLDLRLSAAAASIHSIAVEDLAAVVQVKPGLAAFDISDATIFGGTLQTGLRIERSPGGNKVDMRLLATEVNAAELAAALGSERLSLEGPVDISVLLEGTGHDWKEVLGAAEGTISATMGAGTIRGFDLARFRESLSKGDFFSLLAVAEGTQALEGARIKATVRDGAAYIEQADFLLDGNLLSLDGVIPLVSRALLLSGDITARSAGGAGQQRRASFYVGGGWEAPIVSPVAYGTPE